MSLIIGSFDFVRNRIRRSSGRSGFSRDWRCTGRGDLAIAAEEGVVKLECRRRLVLSAAKPN
ncbi:MAG: hypothetical protein ACR2RB_17665, partial [Gammaproteobacteria bacterium]